MNAIVLAGLLIAVAAALRGMWSPCGLSMISTITPLSERSRGHRYGGTAAWFIIGGVAGGVTLGAAMAAGAWLWSLGSFASSVAVTVFSLATLVTVASDLPGVPVKLPIHPRQVNETWLRRFRAWAYASGFGWQIGTGFATYIMTGAVYLTAVAGVVSGEPLAALGIGVTFGFVRGLCVLAAARATDPARLQRLHTTIERLADASLGVAIGAQIVGLGIVALRADSPVPAIIAVTAVILAVSAFLVRSRQRRNATATAA